MFGTSPFGEYAFGDTAATTPPADTMAPNLSGSVVITAVTSSGAHAAWSAATDNVGVAGYEVSVDTGTPVWMDVGNVTSCDISGKSDSTTFTFRLRAYDDAKNRSSAITGTFTTAAAPVVTGPITVPAARTAVFAANARVAVFSSRALVKLKKGVLDEVWLVADITKDLTDSATTIGSVVPISAGVTILVAPTPQGSLITMKVGVIDLAVLGPYITLRITDSNGQQFDRTILLLVADDQNWAFPKDPDDRLYYAFDFTADLALSAGAKILSAQFQTAVGVSTASAATPQGKQVVGKIAGLATADGAPNSCPVAVIFDNGEKLYRTMYFTREDH